MIEYMGTPMPRYDGPGQVTGATEYVDDISRPGMVYVKTLRSPVPKGLIRGLDFSAAERVPGVLGCLSAKDIPGANLCGKYNDTPVFAGDHVRYMGQNIAAVVAVDEDTATEAVEKIRLDIEEQTPVFDMFEAMQPGAPLVRPESTSNVWTYEPGNMQTRVIKLGDIEAGFREADLVVEGRYANGVQDHASMEPHASVAYLDDSERLVIHTTSQCLFWHLGMLQAILNLPMSRLRFRGGKVGVALAARTTSIRITSPAWPLSSSGSRSSSARRCREDLRYSTKRGPWVFEYRDGVKRDGRIVARHIREYHDTGAYAGMSPYATEKCGMFAAGPYGIPNILVEAKTIFTNKLIASSMRGFSILNGQSCAEVQMSKIANALGMDPWELRFVNAWRDGDLGASRYVVQGAGAIEAMKKTAELAGIELPDHLMAMTSRGR